MFSLEDFGGAEEGRRKVGEKEGGSKTLVSSVSSPSINRRTKAEEAWQSLRNEENIKHAAGEKKKKEEGGQTGWQRVREQQDKIYTVSLGFKRIC